MLARLHGIRGVPSYRSGSSQKYDFAPAPGTIRHPVPTLSNGVTARVVSISARRNDVNRVYVLPGDVTVVATTASMLMASQGWPLILDVSGSTHLSIHCDGSSQREVSVTPVENA